MVMEAQRLGARKQRSSVENAMKCLRYENAKGATCACG